MSLIRDISDAMKPMFATFFATWFAPLLLVIAVSLPALSEEDENESTQSEETEEQAMEESGSPAPVAPVRALPYPDSERHQSIIEHLALFQRSDEVVTLVADPDSFHGLFLREQSGSPQGGALILHDIEQHAHWPELVAPLRETLTDYGWTTLAIELPSAPVERLPMRKSTEPEAPPSEEDSTEENTEETAQEPDAEPDQEPAESLATQDNTPAAETTSGLTAEEKRKAYSEGISERIRSGLGYLASRGQLNNVVIAHGDSAVWAANTVQARQRETENSNGLVLVLVDPREHPLSPLRLSQVLETLEVPVLDIITAEARTSSWQDKQRMGAMKRRHRDQYQQIHLSSASADSNTVLRRIRGWLRTNAAGTELP